MSQCASQEQAWCGLQANTRETTLKQNILHKKKIQFICNYSTYSWDEGLSKRAFVLARFRLRIPKVWRIVNGMLLIAHRTCQLEINARLVQQRHVCLSPVPQALLDLLHRFLVRLIDGHYLLVTSHVVVLNHIIKCINGRDGPGAFVRNQTLTS